MRARVTTRCTPRLPATRSRETLENLAGTGNDRQIADRQRARPTCITAAPATIRSSAGDGNDVLDGGAGADTMVGGTGNDTYSVDNAGDVVIENAGEGTDTVKTSLASYTLTDNVENLTGTVATGQTLTGNALANSIGGRW